MAAAATLATRLDAFLRHSRNEPSAKRTALAVSQALTGRFVRYRTSNDAAAAKLSSKQPAFERSTVSRLVLQGALSAGPPEPVKKWSRMLWGTIAGVVAGAETHAQTPAAWCIVVEIPTERPTPDRILTAPELDKLYAKAWPTRGPVPVPVSAAKKESSAQSEMGAREKAFLSGQDLATYCPLKVISQPPPLTLSAKAAHPSTEKTATRRTGPTRPQKVAILEQHTHKVVVGRHAGLVKERIYLHRAQMWSVAGRSRFFTSWPY